MLYITKYCVQHTQKTYSHPYLAGMSCCFAQEPRRKVTLIYISCSVILGCPKAVNTPHFIYKMLGKFQVSILLPAAFATGPSTAPRHRADRHRGQIRKHKGCVFTSITAFNFLCLTVWRSSHRPVQWSCAPGWGRAILLPPAPQLGWLSAAQAGSIMSGKLQHGRFISA